MWRRFVAWAVERERRVHEEQPRQWRRTTAAIVVMAVLAPLLFSLAVWLFFCSVMLGLLLFRLVVWRRGPDDLAAALLLVSLASTAAFVIWLPVYFVLVT